MNVMTAPPMPFIPPEYHGRIVILAMFCFAGEQKLGERIMNKFRSIAPPLADMIRTLPYPDMYPPEQPDSHPLAANRTLFIDSIDAKTAKNILERLQRSTGTMSVSQIRVLGGAMARIPKNDTAFAHRHSEIMVNLATLYEDPEEKAAHEEWVNDFERSVRQTDEGSYVNFLGNDDEARVRSAYPGKTWEKLSAIKKIYDPDNIFHNTQNIPPEKHVH